MGTPLGAKYIPHTYMDPLGRFSSEGFGSCAGSKGLRDCMHTLMVQIPHNPRGSKYPIVRSLGFG